MKLTLFTIILALTSFTSAKAESKKPSILPVHYSVDLLNFRPVAEVKDAQIKLVGGLIEDRKSSNMLTFYCLNETNFAESAYNWNIYCYRVRLPTCTVIHVTNAFESNHFVCVNRFNLLRLNL